MLKATGPIEARAAFCTDDEDQRMAERQEKRGNEKDDRLNMIPEQRDTFNGHLEPPVDELPEGLDVISEIKRPVLKVRPAGAGRPGANGEEDQCEAENRSSARISREPLCRGHGSCLIPGGAGIQVYQAGDVR